MGEQQVIHLPGDVPMSQSSGHVDGCPDCGDQSIRPEDTAHRTRCATVAAARRAAQEAADAYDISPVAVDDLWAHLVSERATGPWCTPDAAAFVVRCAAELGWRPTVGRWAR